MKTPQFIQSIRQKLNRVWYKENDVKDRILLAVSIFPLDTHKIAKGIGEDINLVSYLVEELRDDGLVNLIEVTVKGGVRAEYIVTITNKGAYSLKLGRGYKRKYRQTILKNSWIVTKTIAAIANAVIIILIGYFSLKKDTIKVEQVKSSKSIDSLNFQILKRDCIILQIRTNQPKSDSNSVSTDSLK